MPALTEDDRDRFPAQRFIVWIDARRFGRRRLEQRLSRSRCWWNSRLSVDLHLLCCLDPTRCAIGAKLLGSERSRGHCQSCLAYCFSTSQLNSTTAVPPLCAHSPAARSADPTLYCYVVVLTLTLQNGIDIDLNCAGNGPEIALARFSPPRPNRVPRRVNRPMSVCGPVIRLASDSCSSTYERVVLVMSFWELGVKSEAASTVSFASPGCTR